MYRAIIPFVLIMSLFSGCLDQSGIDPVPDTAPRLAIAEYETDLLGAIRIEVHGPEVFLDHNGTREGLLMEVTISGEQAPYHQNFFHVSEDWKVLRARFDCAGPLHDSCAYTLTDWMARGYPAPFGIGLLDTAADTDMEVKGHDGPVSLNFTKERDGETTHVEVTSSRTLQPKSVFFSDILPIGRYTFGSASAIFPERFEVDGWQRINGTLTSLEVGELFPVDPSVYRFEPRLVPDWDGLLHPGEEEKVFGTATTILDAIEYMRSKAETADRYLEEGGCVTQYSMSAVPPSFEGTILEERGVTYRIWVTDLNGETVSADMQAFTNALGTEWRFGSEGTPRSSAKECAMTDHKPAVQMSWFRDHAGSLGISYDESVVTYWFAKGIDPDVPFVYRATARPLDVEPQGEGVSFIGLYGPWMDARTGHWTLIWSDPDDVAGFDGR